ncbi:hypothetical protein LXL04_010465 [Taraxacum kok-saghyz]
MTTSLPLHDDLPSSSRRQSHHPPSPPRHLPPSKNPSKMCGRQREDEGEKASVSNFRFILASHLELKGVRTRMTGSKLELFNFMTNIKYGFMNAMKCHERRLIRAYGGALLFKMKEGCCFSSRWRASQTSELSVGIGEEEDATGSCSVNVAELNYANTLGRSIGFENMGDSGMRGMPISA